MLFTGDETSLLYCSEKTFSVIRMCILLIIMKHVLHTEFDNITDDIICVIEFQNCAVYGSGVL